MFRKRERPLHGMMYSLSQIMETLKQISYELKRANDLQADVYLESKKDRHNSDQ